MDDITTFVSVIGNCRLAVMYIGIDSGKLFFLQADWQDGLSFQLKYIPSLMFFGCGIIVGAVSVVRIIRIALENYRPQAVYMILGMMIGSFYAIINGPTTLSVPKVPLSFGTFHIIACIVGCALVIGMQVMKTKMQER